jgi:hypothetical protein
MIKEKLQGFDGLSDILDTMKKTLPQGSKR